MTDRYIQLSFDFDAAPQAPDYVTEAAPLAPVVQLASARFQREKAKKAEDDRTLMERIRARIAHLQA